MIDLNHQTLDLAIRALDEDTSTDTEISVPPGLIQGTPILRNAELHVAGLVVLLRDRLQLSSQSIDMACDHCNTIAALVVCADGEGDEAGAVAGEVIFSPGLKFGGPGLFLEDLVIAVSFMTMNEAMR